MQHLEFARLGTSPAIEPSQNTEEILNRDADARVHSTDYGDDGRSDNLKRLAAPMQLLTPMSFSIIGESGELTPLGKLVVCAASGIFILVLSCVMLQLRLSNGVRNFLRFIGFILLHLVDYATNLLTMYIVYITGHNKYLFVLIPVHITIGIFCLHTAATSIDWHYWNCVPVCKFMFLVVVLGLMQGVQVKLAHDDFQRQRAVESSGDSLLVPSSMPARFHCKAMDGLFEGTIFAFVAMYALFKKPFDANHGGFVLDQWQTAVLYISAFFSFITMGLAMMEVDNRTSAAVQRLVTNSRVAQVRHLLFRSSEVALRLLTVLVFVISLRPVASIGLVAFILVAVDYLIGVILLLFLGGPDPIREAVVLLAVPLFIVNVMQFVDTPGMSLQAQRITKVIVPYRTAQLIGVIIICTVIKGGTTAPHRLWKYLWDDHTEWLALWVFSAFAYYILLVSYAFTTKPEADLHVAVANGNVTALRQLLCSSELVLDINRYGPDGRTPLHLAAARGEMECMQLLVEQRANIRARTGDKMRNTPLHLAVTNKDPKAVQFLCQLRKSDADYLNAVNYDKDTALHVAARHQNVRALEELLRYPLVNLNLKNNSRQTAADCAPSDKFGFDRASPECTINELFRQAQAGNRPGGAQSGELTRVPSSSGSIAASAHSPSPKGASGSGHAAASSLIRNASLNSDDGEAMSPEASGLVGRHEVSVDARPEHRNEHNVPLVSVSKAAEDEFLERNAQNSPLIRASALPVTNCGISSFMLSAGLGALSRAFLNSIREEELDTGADTQQQVMASFDDFTEIKLLGEGAFGKVLLVRQKDTGELFAMKLMDKAKFKAQKITSKAHSEQYILKTTRHPFIVSLSYAFQGSTFWALVMEYCPNGDLQDLLVSKGSPGLDAMFEVARLAGEVLLGIEHLHRIQVIFRDLKLENVVLDPNLRAKLTDFGLAKKLYSPTDARTMCGSYGYAAPEIMMNTGRYTYAVDLYSYGVMLYMLLSGGDPAPKNKKQRLPPMRHSALRRKLRDIERAPPGPWAKPESHAMELLTDLTSDEPRNRGTATEVKERTFFKDQLGAPVDRLLDRPSVAIKDPSDLPMLSPTGSDLEVNQTIPEET